MNNFPDFRFVSRVEHIRFVEFRDPIKRKKEFVGFSENAKDSLPIIFEAFEDMSRSISDLTRENRELSERLSRKPSRSEFRLDLTEWYKLQERLRNE
jgi:hypothetical protein